MAHVKMSLFFKSGNLIWKISEWSELFDSRPFYCETTDSITVKQVLESICRKLFIFLISTGQLIENSPLTRGLIIFLKYLPTFQDIVKVWSILICYYFLLCFFVNVV